MDILDRYILKEFLSYFLVVWAVLAVLFLAIDFFTRYWDLKLTIDRIAVLYLYQIPGVLQQFLPVAVLMATLLVLSTMSKQNEILALYLGGVSLWRLVSTFVAIVATLSTICFLFFDSWVPHFEKRRTLVRQGLNTADEHLLFFGNERFWYRSGGMIYNVGRYSPERNTLEDLNIYILDAQFQVYEQIQSRLARFVNEEWVLEDGWSVIYPNTQFPKIMAFDRRSGVIPEKPSDFKTLRLDESMMQLKDLRRYISRNRAYGFDTTAQQVNYHERVALVFSPLIFVLFAIALSTQARQHSSIRSVSLCFVIIFAYLLLFRVFLSVGRGGHLPPVIAGWSVNGLFLLGAVSLIGKQWWRS